MRYRTSSMDVLDEICYLYYQRHDVVVDVLEANPSLSELGPVLPAGVVIELPDLPQGQEVNRIRLWD